MQNKSKDHMADADPRRTREGRVRHHEAQIRIKTGEVKDCEDEIRACEDEERRLELRRLELIAIKTGIVERRQQALKDIDILHRHLENNHFDPNGYDPDKPSLNKLPLEMKFSVADGENAHVLSTLSQVNTSFHKAIYDSPKLLAVIKHAEKRWTIPPRLIFMNATHYMEYALFHNNIVWFSVNELTLRGVASIQVTDVSEYILAGTQINNCGLFNYTGTNCAYFLTPQTVTSKAWDSIDFDRQRIENYAAAMCDGNLYLAVKEAVSQRDDDEYHPRKTEIRCYSGSINGDYRVVRTYENTVEPMFSPRILTPRQRLYRCPLLVQSDSFIISIQANKDGLIYVSVWKDEVETIITPGRNENGNNLIPRILAYSGHSLAIAYMNPSGNYLASKVTLSSDRAGYDSTYDYPMDNICQMIGVGHGAFIVRTISPHKLYLLRYAKGYVEIETNTPTIRFVGDNIELDADRPTPLENMCNMYYNKDKLIVLGSKVVGAFHVGACIMYDHNYKY